MTKKFTPRPPDLVLKAHLQGEKNRWHEVGVGWTLEDTQGIRLTLHPGTVLRWDDGLTLCIFERISKEETLKP